MKKLFLLLLTVVSLHAMDDNDNNNNNNNDDKALIVKKNTDWNPGAAYYIMHNHMPKKGLFGKQKWGNCCRYYAIDECEKIKAKKCPDLGNPALSKGCRVVAFYTVNKELMLNHLQPIESKSKSDRKVLFKKEQNKLDPNAKPQATRGIIYEGLPPAALVLFDKDDQVIFSYSGFFPDGSKLKQKDRKIIEQYIDVTQLDLTKIKTELQIDEEERQQRKKEKERKKALEKELKKEKR